nr:2-amino-4-hydroxy-6-hydroxymethyldihydropteridine diphosphokinase [Cellvibrionaceae bacterium]
STSSVYESEAVGFEGDHFFNLVARIETDIAVGKLYQGLRKIEDAAGRDRSQARFSSRSLDIDILTYDNLHGTFDGIRLPREEILHNAFVLQPLAELAPEDIHPAKQLSYRQLWQSFDKNTQQLWVVPFEF